MSIDMRYRMLCGLDGEWRLRSETVRRLTDVYETRPEPNGAPAKIATPAVSMLTMGDPRRTDQQVKQNPTIRSKSWMKRVLSPPEIRHPKSKPIAAP